MRKFFIMSIISLPLLFLLSVYATPPGTPTWTVRLHAAYDFQVGDSVEEAGYPIGHVVGVEHRTDASGESSVDIAITLDPDFHDRVRERSTFLVVKPAGSGRPVLRLIVFDEHSPPLLPGSQVAGAESEMEVELKRQLLALEGSVQTLTRQLTELSQTLEDTSRSEEKRHLEESVGNLFEALQRTRDDLGRVLTQEVDRWKKLYNKLLPPEREKPVRFVS